MVGLDVKACKEDVATSCLVSCFLSARAPPRTCSLLAARLGNLYAFYVGPETLGAIVFRSKEFFFLVFCFTIN